MRLRTRLLAGIAAGALLWVPMTSVGLCAALGTLQATNPKVIPLAAYYYWRDHRHVPIVAHWLPPVAEGAGLLAMVPALCALCWPESRRLRQVRTGESVPEPERAASSVHGKADWMTSQEALRRFPGGGEHGGVVLGQLGKAGDAPLLVHPCDNAHGFVVGGTGVGKTHSVVIPTLDPTVGWKSSVVVFDPSCTVSHYTKGMRIAAGQRVVVLGPGKQGINVLAWIDPVDPMAETYVETIVETIGPERKEAKDDDPNAMFFSQGRNVQKCLLADMIWSPDIVRGDEPTGMREVTLRRFAQRMSTPEIEIKSLLAEIYEGEKASASPMARRLAGTLMGIHPRTFSGIYSNAQSEISWLYTKVHADLVSNGDFDPDVLADGNTTAYIEIPMPTLIATREVGRTIVNAILQALYRRDGRVKGRVLILLDEMNLLGSMKALAIARDTARKYKVTLVPMWQSLGQITDTWGVGGKRNWMGGAAWQWFAGVNDEHTAEEISKRCGTYTGISYSENTSRGSSSGGSGSSNRNRSYGVSLVQVPVIRIEDVLTLPLDERVVFPAGAPAIRVQASYWRKRPEMAARIGL